MTGRLAGKVCVVTGAAGGIGGAVVSRFLAEGAVVVASDLAPCTPPAGVPFVQADVGLAGDVARLFGTVETLQGRLDVLVHAGARLGGSGPFLDVTEAEWSGYLAVNATGTFLVCQAAARAMVRCGARGRIITIGSVNSFAAEPQAAPYVASKGAVRLLTKAMAVDLAPHGITANMIAPGPILVERNAALFSRSDMARSFRRQIPAGAPGLPEDVAHAAVYLAEDGSSFVTGTELVVDGGVLAQILPAEEAGPGPP